MRIERPSVARTRRPRYRASVREGAWWAVCALSALSAAGLSPFVACGGATDPDLFGGDGQGGADASASDATTGGGNGALDGSAGGDSGGGSDASPEGGSDTGTDAAPPPNPGTYCGTVGTRNPNGPYCSPVTQACCRRDDEQDGGTASECLAANELCIGGERFVCDDARDCQGASPATCCARIQFGNLDRSSCIPNTTCPSGGGGTTWVQLCQPGVPDQCANPNHRCLAGFALLSGYFVCRTP